MLGFSSGLPMHAGPATAGSTTRPGTTCLSSASTPDPGGRGTPHPLQSTYINGFSLLDSVSKAVCRASYCEIYSEALHNLLKIPQAPLKPEVVAPHTLNPLPRAAEHLSHCFQAGFNCKLEFCAGPADFEICNEALYDLLKIPEVVGHTLNPYPVQQNLSHCFQAGFNCKLEFCAGPATARSTTRPCTTCSSSPSSSCPCAGMRTEASTPPT